MHSIKDEFEPYKKGANYVLTPHFLGGKYVAKMIEEIKMKKREYKKEKHLELLRDVRERQRTFKNR